MKAALATLFLAIASCSLLESEQEATLEIDLPGERSLNDPRDLAGVTVEVRGTGRPRTFYANDFKRPELPPFRVPDSGTATVSVQVVQDAEVVVQGSVSWELLPGTQWIMFVQRDQEPSGGWPFPEDCNEEECPENTRLRCLDWYCRGIWRFAVHEDAARFERDSLWMWLYRVKPGECQDVC